MVITEKVNNKLEQGEIYLITCKINNKKYIGQTHSYYTNGQVYGTKNRFKKHISQSKHPSWNKKCRALYGAMRKYGVNEFKLDIIAKIHNSKLDKYEKNLF